MSPADSPFAPLPAPGPHPAPAELRAYAAGTLSPADEHRIEAHTLDCERCADLLEGFSMSDEATTDRAVAELRTRLQTRLGTPETEPAATGWAWPRLAAAAALVAAVGGGIWTLEQHQTPPATARLETPKSANPSPSAAAPAPPAPAVASADEMIPAPNAEVAAESEETPNTSSTADYAAVTPAQMPRPRLSRTMRPGARPMDDVADRAVLADQAAPPSEARTMAVAKPAAAPPPSPPAASSPADYGYANADAAPARRSDGLLAGRAAAPDSTKALSEVTVASPMMAAKKAKTATAAPTIVANTPMPAGFTIKPAPVGGTPALRDYLRREASQFDPEINNLRLSGTVRLTFIVGADGKISDLKVTRGLRKDYDEEALRLVCEGPAWQPGIAGGKRAPIPVELTVPF